MPAGATARPASCSASPLVVPVGKSRLMQQLRAELQQLGGAILRRCC